MNIFKKMPEGNREKQHPVKNVLLQTCFTSLLSLVLCVTMFLGTTYAWFTSEISNNANEIYIGTLDVGLFKHDGLDGEGKIKWADLASSDTNTTKLFDVSILLCMSCLAGSTCSLYLSWVHGGNDVAS